MRTESQMASGQNDDADYYHACVTEMMTKAQAAPSKAVRRAYLNLALNWVREAVSRQNSENGGGEGAELADPNHWPAPPGSPKSQ